MVLVVLGMPDANVRVWEVLRDCEIMVNALKWRWGRPPIKRLWVDSGGFQILVKGLKVSIEDIVERFKSIEGDLYMSLDVPPRMPGCSDRELLKVNISNFERIYERVDKGTVVPVVHCTFTPDLILDAIDVYRSYGTKVIACGAAVPSIMARHGRGSRLIPLIALAIVRKVFAGRIHVLGVGGSNTMRCVVSALGIDSLDSSAWRVKAAYGKVLVPGLGERYVGDKNAKFGATPLSEEDREILIKFLRETGFPYIDRVEEMMRNFVGRALINAWVSVKAPTVLLPRSRFKWMVRKAEYYSSLSLDELIDEMNKVLNDHRALVTEGGVAGAVSEVAVAQT